MITSCSERNGSYDRASFDFFIKVSQVKKCPELK